MLHRHNPVQTFIRNVFRWGIAIPLWFMFAWPSFRNIYKDEVWFSDRIELGEVDDCPACGGTGKNFYNPFRQCWECGNKEKEGKGTGKIK